MKQHNISIEHIGKLNVFLGRSLLLFFCFTNIACLRKHDKVQASDWNLLVPDGHYEWIGNLRDLGYMTQRADSAIFIVFPNDAGRNFGIQFHSDPIETARFHFIKDDQIVLTERIMTVTYRENPQVTLRNYDEQIIAVLSSYWLADGPIFNDEAFVLRGINVGSLAEIFGPGVPVFKKKNN
jgi:hypothetical protein